MKTGGGFLLSMYKYYRLTEFSPPLKNSTHIIMSKDLRPFSVTCTGRVVWDFLPEIDYRGPLTGPKI